MTPPRRGAREEAGRSTSDDRGVSDLIGFIMVFSLVVSVVAIVSLAGLSSLESARDAEQSNNAERAMEVLADNMADVHQRGAPSRATEISLDEAALDVGEQTLVIVRDPNQGAGDESFLDTRVYQIRPIIYDDGNTELVYVMGAVFRDDPSGGTIIESWDPILDSERTSIPVIATVSATDTGQHLQSSTVLVRGTAIDRDVPVADTDPDPTYDDVWINVSSSRQDLWHRMLSEKSELSCSRNDPDWVNCSLGPTPDQLYVSETRIAVELAE